VAQEIPLRANVAITPYVRSPGVGPRKGCSGRAIGSGRRNGCEQRGSCSLRHRRRTYGRAGCSEPSARYDVADFIGAILLSITRAASRTVEYRPRSNGAA
jgi:hypothetical protein